MPNCDAEYALVDQAGPFKLTCPEPEGALSYFPRPSVRLLEFKVSEVLKQPKGASVAAGTIIQISTAASSAACGVDTQEGTSYLLYPSKLSSAACDTAKTEHMLSTNLCDGNVMSPSAKDIAIYKHQCLLYPTSDS